MIRKWWQSGQPQSSRKKTRRPSGFQKERVRLNLEALESRWVPSAVRPGFQATDFLPNDDGTWPAHGLNDGVPPGTPQRIPLGFTVNFFGVRNTSLFLNNNGNVTFDQPYGTYTPFGMQGTAAQMIAPFFGDVDTRQGGLAHFGSNTVDGHSAWGATWTGVGYYGPGRAHTDHLNTFQVLLIHRPEQHDTCAANPENFDIEFNYDHIDWETGDASGGHNGRGGTSAVVGYTNGDRTVGTGHNFQLTGSLVNGAFLDTGPNALIHHRLNSSVDGRYIFSVCNGQVQRTLSVGAATVSTTEGTAFNGAVATFSDSGGPQPIGNYSATITWGDGHTSPGTISLNGQVFTVRGTNTYAEEGSPSIGVTVRDNTNHTGSVSYSATVSDRSVNGTGGFTINGTRGQDTGQVTVATFTDPAGPEALADYSASIAWGDGGTSAGTITLNGTTFTVRSNHTYSTPGDRTVTVTLHHDTAVNVQVTDRAHITDSSTAPHVTAASNQSGVERAANNFALGSFTDPDSAPYQVDVDWGDGSGHTTFTMTAPGTIPAQPHTYAEEGPKTVTVTVANSARQADHQSFSVAVSDPSVLPTDDTFTLVSVENATSGSQLLATFTDPAGPEAVTDYSAVITWGDGSADSTGVVTYDTASGKFRVSGTHTYAEEGGYNLNVRVVHDSTAPIDIVAYAYVTDANVLATGNFTLTSAENADSGAQTVATFTDPGGAEALANYSADIDWGDGGVSTGTITVSGGVFTVKGSHRYADEGATTITVTIHHDLADDVAVTSTAQTTDPAVVGRGGFTLLGNEGDDSKFQTVATFTDPPGPEDPGDYWATIAWGDGSTSDGGIAYNGGVFTVLGSHSYSEEGLKTITVTIHHDSAADTMVSSMANISDPSVLGTDEYYKMDSVERTDSGLQTLATFIDPAAETEDVANYRAVITWGDGSPDSAGVVTYDSAMDKFRVSGSHNYGEEGIYVLNVRVFHDSAAPTDLLSYAYVADPQVYGGGGYLVTAVTGMDSGPQLVGSFDDSVGSEPVASYAALIDWGDGTTSRGTIGYDATQDSFTITGSHRYARAGMYTISVTISHEDSGDVMVTSMADVEDPTGPGRHGPGLPEGVLAGEAFLARGLAEAAAGQSLGLSSNRLSFGDTLAGTSSPTYSHVTNGVRSSTADSTGLAVAKDSGGQSIELLVKDSAHQKTRGLALNSGLAILLDQGWDDLL